MNTLYLQRVTIHPDPDAQRYPYSLPVIRSFRPWELRSPVTFLIGENGKMALTPYEQTEPYIVTRSFLQNPGRMLHNLLEEE